MSNIDDIKNIISEICQLIKEKSEASKKMNAIAKEVDDIDSVAAAKESLTETLVTPQLAKRLKDYAHYKGNRWKDGNPLELCSAGKSGDKFADRVSQAFIKIKTIIQDLHIAGMEDFLESYYEEMARAGIRIDSSMCDCELNANDTAQLNGIIDRMDECQCVICSAADSIKEKAAALSEFMPKKEVASLIAAYMNDKGDEELARLSDMTELYETLFNNQQFSL